MVKSGLMVGLGETMEELGVVLSDLARAGCRVVTVGQYLRPGRRNLPVVRYVPPEEFAMIAALGRERGILKWCARRSCAVPIRREKQRQKRCVTVVRDPEIA